MENIDTTLCLNCGTDTTINGFVDRIPAGRTNIDGYMCGTCSGDWVDEDDSPEEKWDRVDEHVDRHRIPEVDAMFPDSPAFRELMETEESWTDEDKKKMQDLINGYRTVYPNQITISSAERNDIVEIQFLLEAWKNGDAAIAIGEGSFETWEAKGVEIMHGNRTESICIDTQLE
tara:strand:- start:101 stop:622 length:522 start_codon:yes stop_codon:yes gene_type:complete